MPRHFTGAELDHSEYHRLSMQYLILASLEFCQDIRITEIWSKYVELMNSVKQLFSDDKDGDEGEDLVFLPDNSN